MKEVNQEKSLFSTIDNYRLAYESMSEVRRGRQVGVNSPIWSLTLLC